MVFVVFSYTTAYSLLIRHLDLPPSPTHSVGKARIALERASAQVPSKATGVDPNATGSSGGANLVIGGASVLVPFPSGGFKRGHADSSVSASSPSGKSKPEGKSKAQGSPKRTNKHKKKRVKKVSSATGSEVLSAIMTRTRPSWTDEERRNLEKSADWVREFADYLVARDSDDNADRCCTKVLLLASGRGVFYHRWANDMFYRGKPITMETDFLTLKQEAVAYEAAMVAKYKPLNKEGKSKDASNGWLLKHPIQKLVEFQKAKNN